MSYSADDRPFLEALNRRQPALEGLAGLGRREDAPEVLRAALPRLLEKPIDGEPIEPLSLETADPLYGRRWALTLLERVLRQLRGPMKRCGWARQFEALKFCLTAKRGPAYSRLSSRVCVSPAPLQRKKGGPTR